LWASISGHEDIFVSTVGREEAVIREYIRNQEKEDERLDQLKLEY
jgi:putative transposase